MRLGAKSGLAQRRGGATRSLGLGSLEVALGRRARAVGGAGEDVQGDLERSGELDEREHGRHQKAKVACEQAQLGRWCGTSFSVGGKHERGRHSSGAVDKNVMERVEEQRRRNRNDTRDNAAVVTTKTLRGRVTMGCDSFLGRATT